ncbi:hypothetical protein SADUNF_Sadunf05G0053900 [Salix dunnii]|uniref:Uncharacterized protein n=1 Tax=Salix dunnii TaxID=1413687 RepID=A0A835K6X8_9ROSI|nr:hypothetical protein SADUNF_Sadunf05G0053900 [Salix dunnii]
METMEYLEPRVQPLLPAARLKSKTTLYSREKLICPANHGGGLLVAEFDHTQKVKMLVDAPQSRAAPVTPIAAAPAPSTLQPQPDYRRQLRSN